MNSKPKQDLYYSFRLRTAWHEAGHAVVALLHDVTSVAHIALCKSASEAGYIQLDRCADTMPAEYYLAGCAAEAIVTKECPFDIWDEYICSADNTDDKSKLHAKYPDMTDSEFEATMNNVITILNSNRRQVRRIAKRLLRRGEVVGYRHKWLRGIAVTLVPMKRK